MYFGSTFTVIINDCQLVREFLINNNNLFLNRPNLPIFKKVGIDSNDIIDGHDNEWKHKRLIAMKTIKNFKSNIDTIINDSVNKLLNIFNQYEQTGKSFDPNNACKEYGFSVMFGIAFDRIYKDESYDIDFNICVDSMNKVFKFLGGGSIFEYISFIKPFWKLYLNFTDIGIDPLIKLITNQYEKHLETFNSNELRNYLDVLINEQFQLKEIQGCILDFMMAGSENVGLSILWSILLLANNTKIQEKVHNELKEYIKKYKVSNITNSSKKDTPYTVAFCKEVLRLKPPSPLGVQREAKEDTIVCGHFIPKNAQIITNIKSIQIDERYFDNPLDFNPNRFINNSYNESFIPWSVGPRSCFGQSLSFDEMYICISNIILNYKVNKPKGVDMIDETEIYGMSTRPNNFKITITKYQ